MNEWEQMKKEYREIPIPEHGCHQVMEAMARAKRQKNRERLRKLARYGTVAAAVLLVLLLPGAFLFSGGFGSNAEDNAASMEADSRTENAGTGAWFDSTESASGTDNKASTPMYSVGSSMNNSVAIDSSHKAEAEQPEQGSNKNAGSSDNFMEDKEDYSVAGSLVPEATEEKLKETLEAEEAFAQSLEAISQEILRQMEIRSKETGAIFYYKGREYPEGFEKISAEQEYYINEEGLFVIVFEAGVVASASVGPVEFVIPAEVAAP